MCYSESMDTTYFAGGNPTPASDDTSSSSSQGGHYGSNQDSTVELYTYKVRGRKRTYFIDLKESVNGKFVKISEKSNGMKRTILIDQEDFAEFFGALVEANNLLQA